MDEIPDLVTDLPPDFTITTSITGINSNNNSNSNNNRPLVPKSNKSEIVKNRKIPITIITGYLGSGKSTLLEKIGKNSDKKLAIILNEFGDSSLIEKSVTIQDSNESVQEWLDLGNGCLCCTVKDNGVLAIENLIETCKDKIDYILLETTGVADPAPIAKMFWLDEGLASNIYIDGVVTVVDSEHILTCLDDIGGHWHRENNHLKTKETIGDDLTQEEIDEEQSQLSKGITTAHLQIALADTIIINKVDKLQNDPHKLNQVIDRVKSINIGAPTHTTSFGDISLDKILDLHAFDTSNMMKINQIPNSSSFHDPRINTITIDFPFFTKDCQFDQFELFIRDALWENTINGKSVEIHRLKGILVNKSNNTTKVIQGVRDTYDIIDVLQPAEGVTTNKLVLIGKDLIIDDINLHLSKLL